MSFCPSVCHYRNQGRLRYDHQFFASTKMTLEQVFSLLVFEKILKLYKFVVSLIMSIMLNLLCVSQVTLNL